MSTVHLLNPLANSCGGSEWRSLSLFEVLAEYGDVALWADEHHDSAFLGKFPIRHLDAKRGIYPRNGTLVFVGVYFGAPDWIRRSSFDRIVLIHNISLPKELETLHRIIRKLTRAKLEAVCASHALAAEIAKLDFDSVRIEHSWIDIDRFRPLKIQPVRPFTIGRMNRDVPDKFHVGDAGLYRKLADDGFRIRIMGGTCIRGWAPDHPGIEILPQGAMPPVEFLHGLDVMLYRTADYWFEGFGRAIIEGMACGVVPVAHKRGGYAEVIEHGVDGALYDSDDEAIEWLSNLRSDPNVLQKMSLAARAKAETLYGPDMKRRLAEYYFGEIR